MKTRLMGVEHKTLDDLRRLPPPQRRSATHYPIPHYDAVSTLLSATRRAGLTVADIEVGTSHDGLRLAGVISLADIGSDGASTFLGIVGSHDHSTALRACAGSDLAVCSNMMTWAEVTLSRRNTRWALRDLPGLTDRVISRLITLRGKNEARSRLYRNCELTASEGDSLILDAVERRVVPQQLIQPIRREWYHPRHYEFSMGGHTLWRLQQAFTESWKDEDGLVSIQQLNRRSEGLLALFDARAGVLAS